VRNFLDKFQSYYSIRKIYELLLRNKKNSEITIEKDISIDDCKNVSDNKFIREYYKTINDAIYNKIVEVDNRKILFVNINNQTNDEDLNFIKETFKLNDYPHVNLDNYFPQNNLTNFKVDGHWNDYGHELIGEILYKYLSEHFNNYFAD